MRCVCGGIIVSLVLLSIAHAGPGPWTTLDVPGEANTYLLGIDGDLIVATNQGWDQNYLYDGTSWTPLSYPGASDLKFVGVGGARVLVRYRDSTGDHSCLYDGTGWITLSCPWSASIWAMDFDGDTAVGYFTDEHGQSGFACDGTNGTRQNPWGYNTRTYAVDAGRALVVTEAPWGQVHFVWDTTTGDHHGLEYPGATTTTGIDIEGDLILVSYRDAAWNRHFGLYDGTAWMSLEYPGAFYFDPRGVEDGCVFGDYAASADSLSSFLFDGTNWMILSYPGALQTRVEGISDGRAVGWYEGDGHLHGFVYDLTYENPVPTPGAIALAGFGAALVARLRRCRTFLSLS